jgi:hypothetical protein
VTTPNDRKRSSRAISQVRYGVRVGYAGTVASAQGMTIGNSTTPGVCSSVLSDRASRALAYVGMTRGRDESHLAIHRAVTNEAHHTASPTSACIRCATSRSC